MYVSIYIIEHVLGVYSYAYTIVQLCMDPEDSLESHSLVPISY